jgi:hypothetical protein
VKELCVNLWYWLDRQHNITAIAGKAYLLSGSDKEKGAALLRASGEDYHSVPRTEIEPVHYSTLGSVGIEMFFASEFERLQRALPKGQSLPEEKLFWATPLYDFGEGFAPAEIGDGFIRSRD